MKRAGPNIWVDAQQRLAGHKRALGETGGTEALLHLFDKGLPFTAVVCGALA